MIEGISNTVVLIGGVLSIVGILAGGWLKWGRPKAKQAEAVSEAILGRPEVTDRSGAVIQPAQPGMVAQVAALTDTVRELVNMHQRVDGVEGEQKAIRAEVAEFRIEIGGRVKVLEDARVEQVVSRAESAAAFSAIEAAVKANPDNE